MERCETCKWWKPLTSKQWGNCAKLSNDNRGIEAYYDGYTIHGEDSPMATVDAHKDFGCVLWEGVTDANQ